MHWRCVDTNAQLTNRHEASRLQHLGNATTKATVCMHFSVQKSLMHLYCYQSARVSQSALDFRHPAILSHPLMIEGKPAASYPGTIVQVEDEPHFTLFVISRLNQQHVNQVRLAWHSSALACALPPVCSTPDSRAMSMIAAVDNGLMPPVCLTLRRVLLCSWLSTHFQFCVEV